MAAFDCVNFEVCGGKVDPSSRDTGWEITGVVFDRDAGGPDRRNLERTGRGFCPECSLRIRRNMPVTQESLFA